MKKDILCSECKEKVGYIDSESRVINIYPKDSEVKYVGAYKVAIFTHCDKYQKVTL